MHPGSHASESESWNPIVSGPRAWAGIALGAVLLVSIGCGSDDEPNSDQGDGGFEPPPPSAPELSIRFSVYQLVPAERLLWRGTSTGPDDDSPQKSAMPQIPGARSFRVDWRLVDSSVPILGFQYRVTQDPREGDLRLPRDGEDQPYWGEQTSFLFQNSTPIEAILARCPEGGDCPGVLLFLSDESHALYVFAASVDGFETPSEEAGLEFEIVNEAPTTTLIEDGVYPYWNFLRGERVSFASGDTIPSGVSIYFKVEGEDPDPVVLKWPLPLRFQWRYESVTRSGQLQWESDFYRFFGGTVSLDVHIGTYAIFMRSVDPLHEVDRSPIVMDVVVGFVPLMSELYPGSGDEVLLHFAIDRVWPQNTVEYLGPEANASRWWSGEKFRDSQLLDGDEEWVGMVYYLPLHLKGVPLPSSPGEIAHGPSVSFAYEWISENDPLNRIVDGSGPDNLRGYKGATGWSEYLLIGNQGVEIFVPEELWFSPELFEEGSCPSTPGRDYCGVGSFLRRQLGQIHLLARSRSSAEWSDRGLESELMESNFPLHLGLDDGSGGLTYWPPLN